MKKSTKHMQFLRISLLIFAISFIFACSLGTQSYGKLSLSIEVPEYIKTETNEQPSNARFIHPNGDRLEFELYTKSRVIHTQTIALKSESNSPQRVSITVDKVPYNVPLSAKITVFGKTTSVHGYEGLLGSNDIYIGYLKSGNNKLTLGVKPIGGVNVEYVYDEDGIFLSKMEEGSSADTFNIKMYPKKGLYTVYGYFDNIYLYDSDGKNYQNSFFINGGNTNNTLIFYHPEDKANTYYAYLSKETDYLDGYKLAQDILITKPGDMGGDEIVYSGADVTIYDTKNFTIYNPYPFTLNLTCKIDNADEVSNPDSKDKFEGFPDVLVLLPGQSKEFTVNFQDSDKKYRVKSTISAPGVVSDFVLLFTGTGY